MPTITLNKKVFEELVGKKLSLEKLKDRISMLGTDLEHIEGNEIVVEVFPNRPDMLSEQGFARALSSFIGVKKGLRTYNVGKATKELIIKKPIKEWPHSVCCIVKGLNFTDEKIKEVVAIQEKLATTLLRRRKKGGIGLYPIDKISFPITFTSLPRKEVEFAPLGWQESSSVEKILAEHQAGIAYGEIVKDWKYIPVFLDANQKIMSFPPIVNANDLGRVDESTKAVLIEVSGPDESTINTALNIVVSTLADMGGEIEGVKVVDKEERTFPNLAPKQMKVTCEYINKHLGLNLNEEECTALLERMGHSYENGIIYYPAYRADILHPVDIAEEVAIAYGYENFTPIIPNVATTASEHPSEVVRKKMIDLLLGLGLSEAETVHLSNENSQNKKMCTDYQLVGLKSCVNSEYNVLRRWLLPSLMEVLSSNLNREYPQKVFTFGRTFKPAKAETNVDESMSGSIVLCGERFGFTQIKQTMNYLFSLLSLDLKVKERDYPFYIPGRSGELFIGNRSIGHLGEVHPGVITNWGIEHPVSSAEFNFDEVLKKVLQ